MSTGLRSPRHKVMLREFFTAEAEQRLDSRVPKVRLYSDILLEGRWADRPREERVRLAGKELWLHKRRLARKAKLRKQQATSD